VVPEPDELRTEGRRLGGMARVYDLVCSVGGLGTGFKRRIVELGGLERHHRVLDVGCGTGVLTRLAAERAGEVVGIDAAAKMIAAASSKAAQDGQRVQFEVALIEDLPYPDAHFDVVFSSLMIHHLPPALKLRGLQEVLRVLKAGGRFIVADFDRGGLLPMLLEEAGFSDVRTRGRAWVLGLVSLWEGGKHS
jgi:ubiquinone/menaquinone biosynthesis C-methylase UbiE